MIVNRTVDGPQAEAANIGGGALVQFLQGAIEAGADAVWM
jgi:hypothetical protein